MAQRSVVVQRSNEADEALSDPPSAGMSAGFDGLTFEPSAEATFRKGPMPPQLIAVVVKRLAGGQYSPALAKQVLAWATVNKLPGFGGFKAGAKPAAGGEPLGRSHVALFVSLKLIGFLRDKKIQVDITQEQEEILALGRTTFDLWSDIQGESTKRSAPLPAWYTKAFFDQEMGQHGTLMREYRAALQAHRKGEQGALEKGTTAVAAVFDSISGPAAALEAIRADVALTGNPKTKDAYEALWGPADGGAPVTPKSVQLCMLFLSYSRSQPGTVKKAPTDGAARATLLERFFSFGHDVTFTPMTGDQKIRDIPATANAKPFDATLTSSPPLQPPLFDAAFGTDHRFTMRVQFPHVTDALARWAYHWERVKIPEDTIGKPVEVEKLKGEKPTTGETAAVRFGRATQYNRADIEKAIGLMREDLGPVGVGAATLVAANSILRYVGTGIRLGLELLTMPENQKPIVFPEPGLYMVRCFASPVFEGDVPIKRAPSVAYYPVLARDPNEMATGGVEAALKGRKADRERIALLEAELAKPYPVEVRRELERELAALKVASGPMSKVLESRKADIDKLIADIKAGRAKGDVNELGKQKKQIDKIIALRVKRKVGDKAERLTATFVSDTGQRIGLNLEAVDRPKSGPNHQVYVSDTTTPKSGAEAGYGSTRQVAIERAIRKILEGTAGYGRGRLAIHLGGAVKTLRIEASLGSILMESVENVAMVASLAAVAAAPFTGGGSLVLLIPIGVVGAVPSAFRVAHRVEHGTFEPDLESAMDIVNIAGSVIGLGRVGAVSVRMVRVGKAMMFMGFGADALGGVLMGADLVAKLEELSKLPEGERAAALLLLVGQSMLSAGIIVGGALAEKAHQRRAENKAKGKPSPLADDLFAKAKREQDIAALGKMNEETKGVLKGNEPLRTALVDNPSAAAALKKCASSCFPPAATPDQVARLEKLLSRLKETGTYDEAALKQYFHDRRSDLTGAIANLEGVKTAGDLNAWLKFYNEGRTPTRLPPKGDPRELSLRAERSHDIGVDKGKGQAVADGLSATGFDNPIKGGKFGQGFDDVMRKGANLDTGDVYIVEYKGGDARLAPGQMTLDWVVGNIRRLYIEGGPTGQAWARILSKALREGRLKGVAYSTPIVYGSAQPTKSIGTWNYPKMSVALL